MIIHSLIVGKRVLKELLNDKKLFVLSIVAPFIIIYFLKLFIDAMPPNFPIARYAVPFAAFIVHFLSFLLCGIVIIQTCLHNTIYAAQHNPMLKTKPDGQEKLLNSNNFNPLELSQEVSYLNSQLDLVNQTIRELLESLNDPEKTKTPHRFAALKPGDSGGMVCTDIAAQEISVRISGFLGMFNLLDRRVTSSIRQENQVSLANTKIISTLEALKLFEEQLSILLYTSEQIVNFKLNDKPVAGSVGFHLSEDNTVIHNKLRALYNQYGANPGYDDDPESTEKALDLCFEATKNGLNLKPNPNQT